jgi:ethanolamine transporter EutH
VEFAMDLRDIEIDHCSRQRLRMDTLGQADNVQSSAYIGIAAILAVFILTFAIAPKARAQDKRITTTTAVCAKAAMY